MNWIILFVGPLPPPFGGVSLHISRMAKLLENVFDIDFIDESRPVKKGIFNIRNLDIIEYFRKIKKSDLVYIHSGLTVLRIFHIVSGRLASKKVIMTLHSYPYRKKALSRYIDEFFFKLSDYVIVVNEEILSRISIPKGKFIIRPAFIPPRMEGEPDLPDYVINWVKTRKKEGKFIGCANAWQLKIFNDQDLYGLDMCIEATRQLIHIGTEISFVFNVSSLEVNRAMFEKYQALIDSFHMTNDFLLLNEKISFVRLIEMTDLVLRPTNTDGDALTVREALFLGKPVIASDVVTRPPGTVIFRSRDVKDLEKKIYDIVKTNPGMRVNEIKEYEEEFQEFYSDLIFRTLNKSG